MTLWPLAFSKSAINWVAAVRMPPGPIKAISAAHPVSIVAMAAQQTIDDSKDFFMLLLHFTSSFHWRFMSVSGHLSSALSLILQHEPPHAGSFISLAALPPRIAMRSGLLNPVFRI